ncbi:MAG: DUF2341 domain-containing protein [Thermoguttaceae bacterium]
MPDHSAWSHYKPITVQDANVDANLSDFPLLVVLDGDTDIGSRCRTDGHDLRFTLDDGVTALKYERLEFNVAAGSASGKFWVKVPSIAASGGTTLRVYYGNAAASDGEDAVNVWTNYEAVWHLDDTGSTAADATGNGHTGTINGTTSVTGKIHKGLDFALDTDGVQITDQTNMENIDEFVVEAWCYPRSYGIGTNYGNLIAKDYYSASDDWSLYHGDGAGGTIRLEVNDAIEDSAASSFPNSAWYHVLGSYQRNTVGGHNIFVNGANEGSMDAPDAEIRGSANDVWISGKWDSGKWDGVIEEVRILTTASPSGNLAAYTKFVHANVTEPDHEVSFGTETPNGRRWWFHQFILRGNR